MQRDIDLLIPPYPREGYKHFAEGVLIGLLITAGLWLAPLAVLGVITWK